MLYSEQMLRIYEVEYEAKSLISFSKNFVAQQESIHVTTTIINDKCMYVCMCAYMKIFRCIPSRLLFLSLAIAAPKHKLLFFPLSRNDTEQTLRRRQRKKRPKRNTRWYIGMAWLKDNICQNSSLALIVGKQKHTYAHPPTHTRVGNI